MSDSKIICRLCKSTKLLRDLYERDGDTTFDLKISYCIDVKIFPEDGLPTLICKQCKKKVKKFYKFKQECLLVDLELRHMIYQPATRSEQDMHTQYKCELSDDLSLHPAGNKLNLDGDLVIKEEFQKDKEKLPVLYDQSEPPDVIQCELCGCILKSKIELKKHFTSHGPKKLYQCLYCAKRFTRAETNITHMRSHTGVRPFICDICGRSSSKRQDLIRHMKIHNDEKKHACPSCGRCFKRSSDLCRHIRTHTGTRPYKCMMCDKDYTSHSGLRKHSKTHCK